MLNKLLKVVSEDELRNLLFVEALSPNQIGELCNCSRYTVDKAIAICNIRLDRRVWRSGASHKQRQLALSGTKLTDRQNQILVGSLLGDGHITKKQPKFSFFQCARRREYVAWMSRELEPFSSQVTECPPLLRASGKVHRGYQFHTISHLDFIEYRKLFYPEGKKIVPANIEELLTPLSLSIFYCEDGSHSTDQRRSNLCTHSFTDADCKLLTDVLYEKFNVKSHLQYEKNTAGESRLYPYIAIGATEGYDTFHDIVDPFARQFSCFEHKLGRSKKGKRIGEQVPTSKLTGEGVRNIREACKLPKFTIKEWAEKYNVSSDCISAVIHRRTWKHIKNSAVTASSLFEGR
jgi:hypothetical protein